MRKRALLITAILALSLVGQPATAQLAPLNNTLKAHPAPYLALHGDDPVAWQDWQASVMDRAKADNRIVLISVGYFACHWCHVMQRESFQDREVAQFLNQHFVSVKVDRELEPALDARLMDFAQAIIGRGGWPLNVFVTPEGQPVFALLYAPKEQFLEVLTRLQAFWNKDPERVRELVSQQRTPLIPRSDPDIDIAAMGGVIGSAADKLLANADTFSGGFGVTSKFPSVPQIDFLMTRYAEVGGEQLGAFLRVTLDAMAYQGINDHLSGGFFRYAVDPEWSIPHFEKMLYDNASLASLYLDAGNLFDSSAYHAVARTTLDFMQDYMWLERGFVASFSAVDDDGVEGGHYLWHRDELVEILSQQEFALVAALWGLDETPPLDAGNQPRWVQSVDDLVERSGDKPEQIHALLENARAKMLVRRMTRSLPVDDKLLAGWNGLALSAFSRGYRQYGEDRYRKTAQQLAVLLGVSLWDGERMIRALAKGEPHGSASLEDYAYTATGLYDWSVVSGDEAAAATAEHIARRAWTLFYRDNAWFDEDGSLLAPPVGTSIMEDGPTPSASALLIATSYRIAKSKDDREWIQTIRSVLNRGEALMSENPYWFVSQMQALALVIDDL